MDCGECLPLCNHVNYYVGTVSISMHSGSVEELRRAKKLGDRNDTLPVVAVVKIYHAQRRSSLYVQDVVSEWFNMLSRCPSLITSCCPWFRMDCEFEFARYSRLLRRTDWPLHRVLAAVLLRVRLLSHVAAVEGGGAVVRQSPSEEQADEDKALSDHRLERAAVLQQGHGSLFSAVKPRGD